MATPLILVMVTWLLITPAFFQAKSQVIPDDDDPAAWKKCKPRYNISCNEACNCYDCDRLAVVANCSYRGLTTVPDDLPLNITVLLLKNNSIAAHRPPSFARYQHLEWLDVSKNGLHNLSGVLVGLEKLKYLDLNSNRLKYQPDIFTEDVFAGVSNLTTLHLFNNSNNGTASGDPGFEYPGQALSRLPFLVNLSLDGLPNATFTEGFKSLVFLSSIWFNGYAGQCNIGTLRNDTFNNTPGLVRFEAVNCKIRHIEPDAFSPLKNLTYLDLSYNPDLGFGKLAVGTYGLMNSSIKELHINSIHHRFATCTCVTSCHLRYLRHTQLEIISLNENRVAKVSKEALNMLPKSVTKIKARNNIFTYGDYIEGLQNVTNLKELDLGYGHFKEHSYNFLGGHDIDRSAIEQGCGYDVCPATENHGLDDSVSFDRENKNSFNVEGRQADHTLYLIQDDEGHFPPRSDFAEMESSKHNYPTNFSLPDALTKLSFRWNRMYYDVPRINVSAKDLRELDFSHNFFPELYGPISGLENLTTLNMSYTAVCMISCHFFRNFTSLRTLDLSNNYLGLMPQGNNSCHVLKWLHKLEFLDLSGNGLTRIHRAAFATLSSLIVLKLQNNKLIAETFRFEVFSMPHLIELNLGSNLFGKLDQKTCGDLDDMARKVNKTIKVNLASNPLTCSCKNLEFLIWAHERMAHRRKHRVFLEGNDYTCLKEEGSQAPFNGTLLGKVRQSCVNTILITTVLAVALLLIISATVGSVLYRYRWKLRYIYYSGNKTPNTIPQSSFEYHAYVSYDENDSAFVGSLTATLESRGIKLCIPNRDILANRLEVPSIVEAIQRSRRTVCILSKEYLEEYWCKYEMHMALQEGIETGRDTVLILLYDKNLRARSLPKEVLYCIQKDDYLDYPQDSRCLTYFWDNLEQVLRPSEGLALSV